MKLDRFDFLGSRRAEACAALATVALLLAAAGPLLGNSAVRPSFSLPSSACNYTTAYQTKYASLNSTYGRLEFAKVVMYEHFYLTPTTKQCVDQYHYMAATTIGPANWTVFPSSAPKTNVTLTIQLVNWSTFSSVGAWSLVSGCANTSVSVTQGGAGSAVVSWTGTDPCGPPNAKSAMLANGGIQTSTWGSTRYGQAYPVTFTLKDDVSGGTTTTLPLNMTA